MQLIVLGMHRSGTSMLMRLLNLMGAYFGPEGVTTGANAENPRGFWERRDVRSLNDALLWSMGCDWNRISSLDLAKVPALALTAFRKKAGRIVLEMDGHRPWAMKEPRLCLLLPFWRELLDVPVLIHIHRHPVEVAASLQKRNGIPIDAGMALWERYVVAAHGSAAGIPSISVSYRALVDDPVRALTRLYDGLGELGVKGLRLPSERETLAFISSDLYRERATRVDLQSYLSSRQTRLLEMLEDGLPSDSIGSWTMEAASVDALASYEETLPELPKDNAPAAPSMPEQIKRVEGDVEFLRQIATKFVSDLTERDERLHVLESQSRLISGELKERDSALVERDRQLGDLQQRLQATNSLLALRESEIRDRDTRIAVLDDQLSELGNANKHLAAQLAERDRAVVSLSAARDAADAKVADRFRETEQLTRMLMEKEDEARTLLRNLSALKVAIEQRDERITELELVQVQRETLMLECRQLGERVKWLRDRLRSLETSTSWRATAPFRSVVSMFRGESSDSGIQKADIELIQASTLFDAAWYLRNYADVGESGQDPATHYLLQGGFEGRNPGPEFDSRRYLSQYPDVAKSGVNPLLHFLRFGRAEGRTLWPATATNPLLKNG